MAKSMTEQVIELSDNDFDKLEEIFLDKYQKFIQLYWLLYGWDALIDQLIYNDSEASVLVVDVELSSDAKPAEQMKKIKSAIKEMDNVTCSRKKNRIRIEISKEEEW